MAQGEIHYSRNERVITFGLFYPFVKLKGLANRQTVTAGVDVQYEYFLIKNLGMSFRSFAWFKPLKAEANVKRTLYSIAMQGGGTYRIAPFNFFDPRVMVLGGISRTAAGSKVPAKLSFPVSARLGFNIWRQTERFNDPALAFYTSGGLDYYLNCVKQIDQKVYEVGIYFKGSF